MPCDAWVRSTRARHGAWRLFERGCDAVGSFRVLRTMKAARRSGLPRCRFRRCDEMRLRLPAGRSRVTRAVLWGPCVLHVCACGVSYATTSTPR
jgi:hypothetical protein